MIHSVGPLQLIQSTQGSVEVRFSEIRRGNPIDLVFCQALEAVVGQLESLRALRSVLFRSAGPIFSVGGDLKTLATDPRATPDLALRMTRILNSAIVRLQQLDAPLVAAVQGACAGGMVGFAAGCDILIAAQDARFVSAYATIGLSCDAGTSVMLTRRMGPARTRRYLLLNEQLDANSALEAGLVDFVVDVSELGPCSEAIAAQLSAGPTRAFGETRRLLNCATQPLAVQLECEAQSLFRTVATEDAREGISAFLQKRTATFRGM